MRRTQILLFALVFAVVPAWAQTRIDTADPKVIEAVAARWRDAWNRHDMDTLASLHAEDVDFVTVSGPQGWLKGRQQFKDAHAQVHESMFKESVLTIKETHVKFIRPDVVIAHVLWQTKGDRVPDRKPGEPRDGIFTWIVEKRSDEWLIIASQNTEAKTLPPNR